MPNIILLYDFLDDLLIKLKPIMLAGTAKYFHVLFCGNVADKNLMANAAQKGLIRQGARLQVGAKDNELVKGHGKLLARMEIAKILARFQGIHPAVQQFFGRNLLAAEIVDNENPCFGHGSL